MNKVRLLIVDDEANIRLMLRTALKSDRFELLEAVDGRDALDRIEREEPQLMLLDLSMPRLDGLGVLEEIRGLPPAKRPRTIVLTAYGSIPTAVKATRLGAVDFLEKPIVPDELREAVDAALQESTPTAAPADDLLQGGYAAVIERVRSKLRLAQFADAETLLMKAADLAYHDPAYFNLLGVIYEVQRQWRLARKFYGKAISLDRAYQPAQRNMRRLYELHSFGRSNYDVCLGDEPDVVGVLG